MRLLTSEDVRSNQLAVIGTDRIAADDYGKLLSRLAVGGLMLFHGVHKVSHGVAWATRRTCSS